MNKKSTWENSETDSLIEALLLLKNQEEAKSFLRDLLTEQEILEFGKRWKTAQMLHHNFSYSAIEKETGISSTTIARISKWLQEGMGGYQLILKRLKKDKFLN